MELGPPETVVMDAAQLARAHARALAAESGLGKSKADELLSDLEGASEAKLRSMDPPAEALAERRERHGVAWAAALEIDVPNEHGVTPLDEAIVEDWKQQEG